MPAPNSQPPKPARSRDRRREPPGPVKLLAAFLGIGGGCWVAAGAGSHAVVGAARQAPPAAVSTAAASASASPILPGRPRLVVLISIDQFRADYLGRFGDLFLPPQVGASSSQRAEKAKTAEKSGPGGFRWLMERGAWFVDAHHDHFPLYTGPGHSVLLTGAPPYESGIVGNTWYDRELGRRRYCVEDPASPLVGLPSAEDAATSAADPAKPAKPSAGTGGAAPPAAAAAHPGISPVTLHVDTLGDELKMATGGHARVWGLAFKDRAGVLMAGHLADGVLWLDDESGSWITSRYYRPDGTLPPWLAAYNGQHPADAWVGHTWKLSVPPSALARAWTRTGAGVNASPAFGSQFPHPLGGTPSAGGPGGVGAVGAPGAAGGRPGKDYYAALTGSPFGNDFLFATARELIQREHLGAGPAPDLLAINLSSNDYIGHAFGPDSPEVLDATVRTDRQLADFFGYLDRTVPGGLGRVVVVVAADHGVAPLPAAARDARLPAGVYDDAKVVSAAQHALDAAYGPGPWVKTVVESYLYLDLAALDAHQISHAAAEEVAAAALADQPFLYAAYGRSRILEGRLPHTAIADRIARSFYPRNAGDVVLIPNPFWMPGKLQGTTHGSPYAYDTSVPLLLAGPGLRPGRYTGRASTLDLAPTLAALLGILPPAGSEGHILPALADAGRPAPR